MSYEKSLAKALLKNGVLADNKNYYGGFTSLPTKIYEHAGIECSYDKLNSKLPQCGKWVELTDVKEECDSQFTDTFNDPDVFYFVSSKITCECGRIDKAGFFYEGTFSELLGEVLKSDNLLEY